MGNSMTETITPTVDSSIVFEQVFREHYKSLHAYACSILKDEDTAEEVVQNVFYKLWEKKERIQTLDSIPAYLYRSVYNESLNMIKHNKVKSEHQTHVGYQTNHTEDTADQTNLKELESRLAQAMNELPEQCRTIFQMSRFEELKYREIADKLNLSVKTIENQMGKALKLMRLKLADFLIIIMIFFINQ